MTEIIEVSVACPDHPECRYKDGDLPLEITVRNVSGGALELPVDFMRTSGVFVALVDPVSKDAVPLRRGVPRTDLLDHIETVPAGGTVRIEWPLSPVEITRFGRLSDLVVQVTVMSEGRQNGHPAEARGTGEITILFDPL